MMRVSTKSISAAAAPAGVATSAFAQGAAPTPWELKWDMGYAYGKDGKTLSYKTGTNNAGDATEGRQEGAEGHVVLHRPNGELHMRSWP